MRNFTSDASHELRTPLTAIRTVGEVGIAEPFNPDTCREAVSSMLEEVDRLSRMTDSLLTLTRADSGNFIVRLERLGLLELSQNVAELLRVLAEEKNQRLLVTGDATLGVTADRTILRQAIINLVDNALRHTPAGGLVTIVVEMNPRELPSLAVRDQGPGIDSEDLPRIFDRFYRAETDRNSEGSGLGLAIARWAAQVNHADIEVRSKVNEGSEFRIVFHSKSSIVHRSGVESLPHARASSSAY
jgi:signal transduction histidine kinase